MARRRLSPASAPASLDVPRAEHALETKAFTRLSASPPIAREAADAAGAAALEELAGTLARARETGRMILDLPLDQIAPDHLARDRIPVEDADMAALRESIRTSGQRTPVEVIALDGTPPYGLISGWRRLAALKALHVQTGDARFASIQAIARRPETAADAYVNMVEENEIRVGLSQYERARVAAMAVERGIFPTEKKALLALFATASRAKRSRIRAFLDIYHSLDGVLRWPAHLPERLGLKLVAMVRDGQGGAIAQAIARDDPQTPEAELVLLNALAAPRPLRTPPGTEIAPGIMLESRLRGRKLTLTLTGEGVGLDLAAQIPALLQGLRAKR
jgi:ParB family chromosome partitioning protein